MQKTYDVRKRPLLLSCGCLRLGDRRRRLVMDAEQRQIFALTARLRNLFACRGAEALGLHRKLLLEVAVAEHFHPFKKSVCQSRLDQRLRSNGRAVVECVELLDIDDGVNGAEIRIVESALGNAANQGHLTAFKSESN